MTFSSDLGEVIDALAADDEAELAAEGTGKEGQVPVAFLNFAGLVWLDLFQKGGLVGKDVAVDVGKGNGVAFDQIFKGAEVAFIVMGGDDEVILVSGAGEAAGGDFKVWVAPGIHNGEAQAEARDFDPADVVIVLDLDLRHFHFRIKDVIGDHFLWEVKFFDIRDRGFEASEGGIDGLTGALIVPNIIAGQG